MLFKASTQLLNEPCPGKTILSLDLILFKSEVTSILTLLWATSLNEFIPEDKNVISATTDYSSNIVCSVERENIFGTQFHPEKSDKMGLKIIDNFIKL